MPVLSHAFAALKKRRMRPCSSVKPRLSTAHASIAPEANGPPTAPASTPAIMTAWSCEKNSAGNPMPRATKLIATATRRPTTSAKMPVGTSSTASRIHTAAMRPKISALEKPRCARSSTVTTPTQKSPK